MSVTFMEYRDHAYMNAGNFHASNGLRLLTWLSRIWDITDKIKDPRVLTLAKLAGDRVPPIFL